MPRIRSIKPDFFTSLTVAQLSSFERLTFIGLWTYVDDDGRGVDDARLIRAAVWPLDDRTVSDVESDLARLDDAGVVRRYEVDGRRYLIVTNWGEHQKVSHPRPSRYPAPPAEVTESSGADPESSGSSPESSGAAPPRAGAEQGAGSREQGRERNTPPVVPLAGDERANGDPSPTKEPKRTRATKRPATDPPITIEPSDAHREKAARHGLDLGREIERCLNHHRAKGNRYVDWGAVLHKWLDRAPGFSRRHPATSAANGTTTPPPDEEFFPDDGHEAKKRREQEVEAKDRAWQEEMRKRLGEQSEETRAEISQEASAPFAAMRRMNPSGFERATRRRELEILGERLGRPAPVGSQ